ncbi:MAG: hypothetical protein CM1200mP29_01380 [Verrucomicrobiota bacterium]|nr:MAG: hypothetical protein CM1200mP29_01380 [Verrucomicrobiota bacterium]
MAYRPERGPGGRLHRGILHWGRGSIQLWRHVVRWSAEFLFAISNATLPDGKPGEYLPDRFVNEAIGFIRDHKAKPWMVHLWFYTVHWPREAPKDC